MNNLVIYCKDFELTNAINQYLEQKLTQLYKYINVAIEDIVFKCRLGKISNKQRNGTIYYIDTTITTPKKNFGGRIAADNIYTAIDLLKDELIDNIKSYKNKLRTTNKKTAQIFKEQTHRI